MTMQGKGFTFLIIRLQIIARQHIRSALSTGQLKTAQGQLAQSLGIYGYTAALMVVGSGCKQAGQSRLA